MFFKNEILFIHFVIKNFDFFQIELGLFAFRVEIRGVFYHFHYLNIANLFDT